MSDENGQPVVPPSPPPEDLSALQKQLTKLQNELDKAERSYNGLDGNFKTVKEERDSLKTQIQELNTRITTEKAALASERDTFKTTAEQKAAELAALQGTHSAASKKLEAMQILLGEFPELVPAYSKKLIRIDGLEGDELKSYLTAWKESGADLGFNGGKNKSDGISPPPPNQEMGSISLDEASENKVKALRASGPQSEDYKRWAKIEGDLIAQRKK